MRQRGQQCGAAFGIARDDAAGRGDGDAPRGS